MTTRSLPDPPTDQLTVHAARARLDAAQARLASADRAEQTAERRVHNHGGPGDCSVHLAMTLMRSREVVFFAHTQVMRCERELAEATAQALNGARA